MVFKAKNAIKRYGYSCIFTYGLFLLMADLFFPVSAQAQVWFPSNAMQCSLSSADVNLGIVSRITDAPIIATGDWGVDCRSNAYPVGYRDDFILAEGGYCVTIDGNPASRVLKGTGKNAGIEIPFQFYFSRQKIFEKHYKQDYDSPIGNGTWGIGYIDWNYKKGDRKGLKPPVQVDPHIALPGRGKFDVKIDPRAGGRVYPDGIYSNSFVFNWRVGSVQKVAQYPEPSEGPAVCEYFPYVGGRNVINVKLEVKKYCYVSTKNDINFGLHPALNKPLNQEGTIEVECSEGTQYGVAINDGLNSGGKGKRAMKRENGTETINYELYQDAAHTRPWGSNWSSSDIYKGVGTARPLVLPVYAKVPLQQGDKRSGIYQDKLVVEVRVTDPG